MRDNGTSENSCGYWFDEKWLNFILKIDPVEFTDELNVACEIIFKKSSMAAKFLELATGQIQFPLIELKYTLGVTILGVILMGQFWTYGNCNVY